ncbi:AlpA family phage regulatory protein [Rhizobium sp. FKL33]|uniref:helix-turn-helix transcriptional regulator n=1 Tax=Rhizobium sp. FKL33 TaxID=2562307 RepID=UPI0010C00754|nr:AlpA family phage regulatory protein [Rhizobium sp. FKL33]
MTETPRLLSLNAACELTSLSRTAVNRYRAEGRFPQAVNLGEKRIAFVRDEVVAWIEARIAARQHKSGSGAR